MVDQVLHGAAGLDHIGRQPEHLDVALVADGNVRRCVVDDQALRHVVDGGVEALLFHLVLLRQLADRQKQHGRDQQHRDAGHRHQKSDLVAPIGQGGRYGLGGDDRNREIAQHARRGEPVQPVDRTGQPDRAVIGLRQNLLMNRIACKILPDHLVDVRVARQQRSVAMVHRDRRVIAQRHRPEESLETGGRDRAGDDAQKFAVGRRDAVGDDGGPASGETALHQFDQNRRCRGFRFEGLEVGAIGDVDVRHRPAFRRIDQFAVRVEHVDAGDVGVSADLGFQHFVHFRARHSTPESVRRSDSGKLDLGCDFFLDGDEIFEFLIEVAGQQQHGIFQLALTAVQRAFAEHPGYHGGADHNAGDQQRAADRQPADRIAANRSLDVGGGVSHGRH